MSAYSESPFFEYYADDIRPFFEKKWDFLYDFNQEACHTVCSLLDIHPNIQPTSEYIKKDDLPKDIFDFREAIDPKHPAVDADFVPRRYYQVFERKIGFQPNLSMLDPLFNTGPEGILYLRYPHLGHTPFSSRETPQRGQRSICFLSLNSAEAAFTPLVKVILAMLSLSFSRS